MEANALKVFKPFDIVLISDKGKLNNGRVAILTNPISLEDKLWQAELIRSRIKIICREKGMVVIKSVDVTHDTLLKHAKACIDLKKNGDKNGPF